MTNRMQRRYYEIEELRAEAPEPEKTPVITGHAAVFNQLSEDLGIWSSWYETIEPGAFAETIARDDIRALVNHDPNYVLGRTRAGTLELSEDTTGLKVVISPPGTTWANDLLVSIGRRDITQMSIGFTVLDERWEKKDGKRIRRIGKVQLFDVSPVTFPAYPQTDVSVDARSLEIAGLNAEAMFRILLQQSRGLGLEPGDTAEIHRILDYFARLLPPDDPSRQEADGPAPQEWRRLAEKRLRLAAAAAGL